MQQTLALPIASGKQLAHCQSCLPAYEIVHAELFPVLGAMWRPLAGRPLTSASMLPLAVSKCFASMLHFCYNMR